MIGPVLPGFVLPGSVPPGFVLPGSAFPDFALPGSALPDHSQLCLTARSSCHLFWDFPRMELTRNPILSLAAQIVSAHVGNNATSTDTLPALIRDVYRTLSEVGHETGAPAARPPAPARAVPMREAEDLDGAEEHEQHNGHDGHIHQPIPDGGQTVFDDHLVCMDCGLPMKMLKRHLITVHAMTPEEYRKKWNLPSDYPMVTSSYAALRSSLAKQSGLGKRPEVKSKVPHHRVVAARARR